MTTVGSDQMTTTGTQQRVEEFKQEIADMRLRDPATARDRLWLRLGILLMVGGIGLAIAAYFGSHAAEGASAPLEQRDYIIGALIGVALTIAGAALFVRYSMAQFLRFWLARLSYEQQHQTDRVVEAIKQ